MLPAGSEKLTSTAAAGDELAGDGGILELARSTDASLTAPAPGSEEARALEQNEQQQPRLTLEQEFAGMAAMIGAGLGQWLPSVKSVLNEEACAELGRVLAPVAHKYGIARFVEGFAWRLELQALMVVVPIGFAIAGAVKHDLAQLERAQPGAEGLQAAGAPGAEISSAAAAASSSAAPPGMLQPIDRARP